jgi:D-beta-D-heptose 7-phosphate kinase/D-beta-D-heptose 1-phosphate adenosyltransferase
MILQDKNPGIVQSSKYREFARALSSDRKLPSCPSGVALLRWWFMAKILSVEELRIEREELRRQKKCVVLTNGCFDLLHPGHVRYLQEARSLGDVLIVALNSDRSVRELKGSGRPILNENERAEVMAALRCVDYVTIFNEPTPREVIATLLPDILVKGGDWKINHIIGREEVLASGGKVLSLRFVDGYSTTDVIERIKKKMLDAGC